MSLFHTHKYNTISAYDREKIIYPSVLATEGTDEEDIDFEPVTDIIQQCGECNELRFKTFPGHHAAQLVTYRAKAKAKATPVKSVKKTAKK